VDAPELAAGRQVGRPRRRRPGPGEGPGVVARALEEPAHPVGPGVLREVVHGPGAAGPGRRRDPYISFLRG
jgi:hypothetical protein